MILVPYNVVVGTTSAKQDTVVYHIVMSGKVSAKILSDDTAVEGIFHLVVEADIIDFGQCRHDTAHIFSHVVVGIVFLNLDGSCRTIVDGLLLLLSAVGIGFTEAIDKLTHQDLGQMQMYVNYFDRHVKLDFEKPTIGILLCKTKKDALVELTLPEDANIYASAYELCLPEKTLLQQKLRAWIDEFEGKEEPPEE